MKIVLLAAASSIHTIRWANGLNAEGVEVHVVSQHRIIEPFSEGVHVHIFPYRGVFGYFGMAPGVRSLLRRIGPDLVNAHYASGYGTTARLIGFHPWLLSVWGSDVYDFPEISRLHKLLVRGNLRSADNVASTSACMAEQTRSLEPSLNDIKITPFGVDVEKYQGVSRKENGDKNVTSPLIVGTVKTMAHKYGIDTLIKAFSMARRTLEFYDCELASRLRLRLIGDGPQIADLKSLAQREGVEDVTTFVGRIQHEDVPQSLAELDIFVALSRLDSESFGVAIIEASAAGLPVVVSDAGGLPEVTKHGETGLVVPREDPEAASKAILQLVQDSCLRLTMGSAGKLHVAERYNWKSCILTMKEIYRQMVEQNEQK